jgi:hypothetical protein
MHYLDPLDHLGCDMKHTVEVELSLAFLEEILETLAEHVHDHNVVHLAVFGLLVTNEMKIWYSSFSSQFVNKLRLPEEHDVLLILHSFLYLGGEMVTGLLLLNFVDFTEGTSSESLDDLVSLIENFLSFFHSKFFQIKF